MPGILGPHRLHCSLAEFVKEKGAPPWSEKLVENENVSATLIHHGPGQKSKPHMHPDTDEWWLVVQGELLWDLGEHGQVRAKAGEVVFVPRGIFHSIAVVGDTPATRLAVDVPNLVYVRAE